jgi:tetratricopeptide (TPR) repeat protein
MSSSGYRSIGPLVDPVTFPHISTASSSHQVDNGCIIIRHNFCGRRGNAGLTQRYTRREAGRILGVEPSRLRYWERLRLVRPRARWGERFYSFGDLVALRTIKHLTECKIPARRVRLAVWLTEQQFGAEPRPLQEHCIRQRGREILVVPPGTPMPFNPIRRQWVFPFEPSEVPSKLRSMVGRTPEQLFEMALDCEATTETLPEAIEIYERVVNLSPDWIEAHINLGVAYYQTGQISDACAAFRAAVELDPLNGISRYNLGCTLEELGEVDEAVEHLRRAARAMPAHADVHFNLALAYEKRGERRFAREQWLLYLRYAPSGPWADQARARLKQYTGRPRHSRPIPFRRPR